MSNNDNRGGQVICINCKGNFHNLVNGLCGDCMPRPKKTAKEVIDQAKLRWTVEKECIESYLSRNKHRITRAEDREQRESIANLSGMLEGADCILEDLKHEGIK
jgi:hypothetical protein